MKVTLTPEEMLFGAEIAISRIRRAIDSNLADRKHSGRHYRTWDVDMEGAMGEIAVSKAFHLPVNRRFRETDVGHNIEVRTTKYDTGKLVIKKTDKYGEYAILVVGQFGQYSIRGYLPVEQGKQERFWDPKFKVYMVPQDELLPLKDLH
jgi:hypothetical protein